MFKGSQIHHKLTVTVISTTQPLRVSVSLKHSTPNSNSQEPATLGPGAEATDTEPLGVAADVLALPDPP